MKKCLRIKPYLHLLEHDSVVSFIKTLDEGIKFMPGKYFETLLAVFQSANEEEKIIAGLCDKLLIGESDARLLLHKLLESGVTEYYENKTKYNRFHRQLLLFDCTQPKKEFEENYLLQQKLEQTHILILGIGGIGNYMATAFVAAGVGKITLADFDVVEEANLNRQILFAESDIGKSKAEAAVNRLRALNPVCKINYIKTEIESQTDLESVLMELKKTDYIVLSADKPVDLVLFASELCKKYFFKYIKCGYMGYQGLVGPLLGYDTKAYNEIYSNWGDDIRNQNAFVKTHNQNHIAPSMAATNGILANIAAWELIKDITKIAPSAITEKRMLFNLKTMEMVYG